MNFVCLMGKITVTGKNLDEQGTYIFIKLILIAFDKSILGTFCLFSKYRHFKFLKNFELDVRFVVDWSFM